jgi:hypothetical protein
VRRSTPPAETGRLDWEEEVEIGVEEREGYIERDEEATGGGEANEEPATGLNGESGASELPRGGVRETTSRM